MRMQEIEYLKNDIKNKIRRLFSRATLEPIYGSKLFEVPKSPKNYLEDWRNGTTSVGSI